VNVQEFILSGIIEVYCLGFTSEEENTMVNSMASQFPEVAVEIETVRAALNKAIFQTELKPRASLKQAVMQQVYEQQTQIQPEFIPLLHQLVEIQRLEEVIKANTIPGFIADEEESQIFELPSTREVINLAAWIRYRQEAEIHDDFNEYIAIMEGACTMYFDGKPVNYSKGQVIVIPPGVLHYAIVTSETPMLALVQRQIL